MRMFATCVVGTIGNRTNINNNMMHECTEAIVYADRCEATRDRIIVKVMGRQCPIMVIIIVITNITAA